MFYFKQTVRTRNVVPGKQLRPRKCSYLYLTGKLTKFCIIANKWQLKEEELPFKLQACRLDRHIRCPTTQVTINDSPKTTWRNQSLNSGETDLFFSCSISSQQPTNLTIPCAIIVARCSLQSMSSDTLKPASVSPSPLSQIPNRHGPLLRLRPRLRSRLSFQQSALLLNFSPATQIYVQHLNLSEPCVLYIGRL